MGLQFGGEGRHNQSPDHVGTEQTFGEPGSDDQGFWEPTLQAAPVDQEYDQDAFPQVGGQQGNQRGSRQR